VIRTDRTYRFEDDPATVWAAITRCGDYRSWWPWLRSFDHADGFAEGAVWRARVQPPTPWAVRFTLTLDEVDPVRSVVATITGDIAGTASIALSADGAGSSIRLVSDLAPAARLLRAVAVAARPLAVWGHDWVLDQGVAQIRRKALGPRRREG
jgi:uncharacterized protein YndB with AHSA1/START domain